MTKETKERRINLLKDMHEYIIDKIGDEEVYLTWATYGVPDEPQEDDFEYIAENETLWNETLEIFRHLALNYR